MAYYAKRHAFKIKLTQELKPLDHLKRRNFSNWALAKLEENEEFHQKIIFSDKAHFWLNGFVNKQNMPLDFFSWGHIKSRKYQREIANVRVKMCARVVENLVQRIARCKRARGGHMTDIELHS